MSPEKFVKPKELKIKDSDKKHVVDK